MSRRDMTPQEVAVALVVLANNRPTSGNLLNLNKALDAFRGRGELLDAELIKFDRASVQFVRMVQRGYAGTSQWRELKASAQKIAPMLEIISQTTSA